MSDFFEIVIIVLVVFVLMTGTIVAGSIANAYWNCHSYETSNAKKVMGGECYIKDGDRWVLMQAYTKRYNVEMK